MKRLTPLKIALIYGVVGGLWILFSDRLIEIVARDIEMLSRLQTYKGWFFIFITALLVYILIKHHVSGIRHSEEALHESEKRLSQIIQGNSIATFVINNEHKVTHWNKACENLTGISANKIIRAQKLWEPFYFVERPVMADLIVDNALEKEISYYYKGKYRASTTIDGAYEAEDFFSNLGENGKWLFFTAAPLRDPEGKIIGAIETLQDITERKLAEAALRKAHDELEIRVEERTADLRKANEELKQAKEAAEAVTQAKSDFLANMSHEIRTPMSGVITAAELVMNEKLPPRAEHYLKIIYSSAHSLLGLINDILDFSKIEAAKLDLETRPFELDKVLGSITDMFANRAAKKGIEFLVDIDPETSKALIGDSLRLQQILKNLVDNAVKFTEKDGVILVGVKVLEKASDRQSLTFFVRDTGIGIAPEHLGMLFKPFTQVDASSTRKYGGTGLGLAISKQLVEMMAGKIWAESERGKGSTFFFTIDFELQTEARERKLVAPPDISGLSVLVVDDCPDSRAIMQKLLESFGFSVEMAFSGKEALAMLKENQTRKEPFKLVMIDWMMPELDGIETSKRIRRDLNLTLPIIMMTAFGKETEKMDAELVGINAFLTKPISTSTLFDAIMDTFGKQAMKIGTKKEPIITKASIYKNRLKGIRILVAEDNPTNQEIALAVLQNAGIVAEIANNGKEALEAVNKSSFDAVLMDIQMPEMDGYEATKQIRKDPKFASLPIIAMTAHAMKGDEEKCLEAGMDGYVSKPMDQNRLFHTIWKLIKPQKRQLQEKEPETESLEEAVQAPEELPSKLPGINIQDALNGLNIGRDVFKRILMGFLDNNKDTIKKIKEAFDKKDRATLLLLAHTLKGSAANIGADDLQEAALKLEAASREETGKPVAYSLIENVETTLNQLLKSLQSIVETPKSVSYKETPVDTLKLLPLLQPLAAALKMADPLGIKKHMEVAKEYLDRSSFQHLENQINGYDYDEALETLKGIAENLGGQLD